MDNRSFYRLRCKWFGHKWELRLIRNQIIDWNSIFKNLNISIERGKLPDDNFEYFCKCGKTVGIEEYSMIERDKKINKILG
jgi:hypothetical protein